AMLPGRRALEQREQVEPRGFELVTYEPKAEQKDPEIVLGGRRIELAPLAAGALGLQCLVREGQDELDVCLDLACVQSAIEGAVLNCSAVEQTMQIQGTIASRAIVLGMHARVSVPGAIERLHRLRPVVLEPLEEARIDAL